jgi:hypothetical protein
VVVTVTVMDVMAAVEEIVVLGVVMVDVMVDVMVVDAIVVVDAKLTKLLYRLHVDYVHFSNKM